MVKTFTPQTTKSVQIVDSATEFASKIGATVAGSRAAVEAGLIDATLQVGQTGHTISPDLYIAINTNPSAQIFNCADYGYVGSVEDALPQLIL